MAGLGESGSAPAIEIVTRADRPDLDDQAGAAFRPGWPEFLFHDQIVHEYIGRFGDYFSRYDILVLDRGEVVAGGWGVPLQWDGAIASLPEGYDGALVRAVTGREESARPDSLVIMAASVKPGRRGAGLAGQVLTALRERAVAAGLERVIAPVRPTLKERYPLTPMDRFARWSRPDGLHLDPWIRTHQRLGASILAPAPHSMIITGSVAEWEGWAAMAFPETGSYVVAGALDLVEIDREWDRGSYTEPNLWMRHL